MIASAKKMSERETLIRKLEKQAAHDAVHFCPPIPPISDFVESDSSPVEATYIPHAWQLGPEPISAAQQAPPARPKSKLVIRKRMAVAGEDVSDSKPAAATCTGSPAEDQKPGDPPDPIAKLRELVTRAKYGDTEALESIRQELDNNPGLWQAVGDLSALAEELLISIIADGNALVAQSMHREIKRLKIELAEGIAPTPLERLAIQRIVACWLHCQHVDRATLIADATGSKIAVWGKRQEAAERRFQSAIRSFDLARRLAPKRGLAKATTLVPGRQSDQVKRQGTATPKAMMRELPAPTEPRKQPVVNGSDIQPSPPNNRIRKFIRQEVAAT